MDETELKNLNKAQIDHHLIMLPSEISKIETELAEKKQIQELIKNEYDVAFSRAIKKSEGTNELMRKSDAIIATEELKIKVIVAETDYLKAKAKYHAGLNRHESTIELARNKRVEMKHQIESV